MTHRIAIAAGLIGMLISPHFAEAGRTQKPVRKPTATPRKPEPLRKSETDVAPAYHDKRRIIGILDVRVDGAPPEVGSQFQRDLENQIDVEHFFMAPRSRMREMLANSTRWSEGCIVGPCLAEVKTHTHADIVLLAALTGEGTSFGWVVTLVRTDNGNVLSQRSERCDVCTVNEALSAAALATVELLSAIPDTLPEERPILDAPASPPVGPLIAEITQLEHRRLATGVWLGIAGVAVAATGTALYFAQTPHPTYGAAAAAGGVGLALGGLVLAF